MSWKGNIEGLLRDLFRWWEIGLVGICHRQFLGLELFSGACGYPGEFGDEGLAPECTER
jgi:hypothetical protein